MIRNGSWPESFALLDGGSSGAVNARHSAFARAAAAPVSGQGDGHGRDRAGTAADGRRTAPLPGAERHRIARCALRPRPCSAKAAREFTCAALRDWDASEVFENAAVVISELVTNAIRYGLGGESLSAAADGRIELVLLRLADVLVCVVTDPSPQAPMLAEPDFVAEGGRGLHVVDALSSRWGWTPLSDGCKAVWAALPA